MDVFNVSVAVGVCFLIIKELIKLVRELASKKNGSDGNAARIEWRTQQSLQHEAIIDTIKEIDT